MRGREEGGREGEGKGGRMGGWWWEESGAGGGIKAKFGKLS